MPIQTLPATALRLRVDPGALGFADTAELVGLPLPWIGQERAEQAARFGLGIEQPGYHLFVLGETGSGRTTLLHELVRQVAATRPVPPDLVYLHDFEAPERPRALRLPPGQGRQLRALMAELAKTLQTQIPRRLLAPDFKVGADRAQAASQAEEERGFAELSAFAQARQFGLGPGPWCQPDGSYGGIHGVRRMDHIALRERPVMGQQNISEAVDAHVASRIGGLW